MVVTDDEAVFEKVSLLKFHGMDRNAWKRFAKSGSPRYDIALPGYKYNMMDIQAALGLHQLPKLDGFIERRRKLAEAYQRDFREAPLHPSGGRSLAVEARLAPLRAARRRRPADDRPGPLHGGAQRAKHRLRPPLLRRARVLVLPGEIRLEAGRLSGGPLRLREDRLSAALPGHDRVRRGRTSSKRSSTSPGSSASDGSGSAF